MTHEQLRLLLNACNHHGEAGHYEAVARHLGVAPITLRRWLSGERPVPRQVEVIITIYHFWKQVTAEGVDKLIQARDEGSKA